MNGKLICNGRFTFEFANRIAKNVKCNKDFFTTHVQTSISAKESQLSPKWKNDRKCKCEYLFKCTLQNYLDNISYYVTL